ncbi:DNA modification methylase [filamentous cyanobacterium CCT1]|nr:DNA modification methylase [filamentous cyanobacterium CCT1]PSN81339.1 DNA modification methylase [filamentous cyanobacterium CCP4]
MKNHPSTVLNAICPYFTMFPLGFPLEVLSKANPKDSVLDPFCGRGTTLFAARMSGLKAFGIDSNPVAVAITKAKLYSPQRESIKQNLQRILQSKQDFEIPKGKFWELAYHPQTLEEICKVRQSLLSNPDNCQRAFLRGLILGALHGPIPKKIENASYLSNQMPRTFGPKPEYSVRYWEENNLRPIRIPVERVVERRLDHYLNGQLPKATGGFVQFGDSRSSTAFAKISNVKWIVTSPPYYGLNTYVTDQWIRHWFVGGPDKPEYSFNKQMTHLSPEGFAKDLAKVWDNCGQSARVGALMYIRFGGLSSRKASPKDVLENSISLSKYNWSILSIRDAGSAESGRRQAVQMGSAKSKSKSEFDMILKLS